MVAERMSKGKRKTLETTNDANGVAGKKRKTSRTDEEEYKCDDSFCQLMKKVSFHLKTGKSQNEIGCDQAVLQRNLQLAIKKSSDCSKVIEEFIEGFQTYIDDRKRFYYALLPARTTSDCTNARGSTQDCLVRILLGTEIIQPQLMTCLLEKLAEFMSDDETIFEHGERVNLPRILMNQFRWLDRIVNGKEVTEKILEMVEVVPPDIQRELITSLPEVVEDSEHAHVATTFRDLLTRNKDLTVPILDALSNLTLKPELLSEMQSCVLQTLSSVEIEDLPVVIKFLLHSVDNTDAVEVVSEIRTNLDFDSTFTPVVSSTPHNSTLQRKSHKSGDVQSGAIGLTLEAIKSGVKFRKNIAEAWIKVLDGIKQPGDHKVMDVLVAFILHSTDYHKPVQSLFRNKIRTGAFSELLLQTAFESHADVLRDYFPSILSLSEVLLRSVEPSITYFASAMYKQAFVCFDTFCQQEIISNLVTHIGSGFEEEVNSTLDILSVLVDRHLPKMAPFAIFVKGVLDYIDNMTVTQIRKLYSLLSVLAFRNPQDGGLIQDDLHIIIRKQLSSDTAKYKRMGIIGAIMVVKSIASDRSVEGKCQQLDDSMYKQVVSLLQLVRSSYGAMPEASALFMDELSSVVQHGHLNTKVEEWISENVTSDFQDDFIVDFETPPAKSVIPAEAKFGLDDETENSILIPLLSLVEKVYPNRKCQRVKTAGPGHSVDPMCLASHFRLLSMCEQEQTGNLENIDALLGCPLFITKDEVYQKLEPLSTKEKDIVCEMLFHTLNWFRELVNAFTTQSETEMKGKVITRLQNITDIQNVLKRCLAVHPTYKPPMASFDWYDSPVPQLTSGPSEAKKKGKKAGKKKKAGQEQDGDDADESSRDSSILDKTAACDTTQAPQSTQDSVGKVCVDLTSYEVFFRELDISVFTILNTGMITKANLDTEMNTKATTEVRIQPRQLEFLLEDLSRKLSHSLIASTSKRKSFLKPKSDKKVGFSHLDQLTPVTIATKVVELLPALCDHIEGTSGFFQTLIADNDGLIDGPGSFTEETRLMGNCYHLLLQILLSLFSWNGFVMTENRQLLKQGLETIASRIKSSGATQVGLQELVKYTYQYVENLADTVPTLRTAVVLVRLLTVLAEKSTNNALPAKITAVCEGFLKRDWYDSNGEKEKGAKHNENLQVILKTFLCTSDDVLAAAEAIATKGIPELLDTDKNASSSTYPTLTRSSFPLFYRALFTELVSSVKGLNPGKQSDMTEVRLDKLLRWNQAVRILHILINLIKAFDARSNLGTALKYGRQFIEIFLRQGMPMLDQMFRFHRDDVQGLLKNLQLSTRNLHHMCGHSKIMKDLALTNQVPMLKKCLEAFVYRVKAMLTLNKCLDAFWLGNLKNKDLRGEEIVSQSSTVSETTAGDDDDQDVEEEEEEENSDVELEDQSEMENEESHSGPNSDEDSCSIQY